MSKFFYMENFDTTSVFTWLSLLLPAIFVAYKCTTIVAVRRRINLYFPLRLLSFYSEEQIRNTSSRTKRDYMKKYNRVTVMIYACIAPYLAITMIPYMFKLTLFLGNIL